MSKPKSAAASAAAAIPAATIPDASLAERAAIEAQATERAEEAVATAEAAQATHVDARVLADCEFGKPNDLASVPVERVVELEASFVIDTHPAAVSFARRLAAGEIKA